jgi:hypothetical protein
MREFAASSPVLPACSCLGQAGSQAPGDVTSPIRTKASSEDTGGPRAEKRKTKPNVRYAGNECL